MPLGRDIAEAGNVRVATLTSSYCYVYVFLLLGSSRAKVVCVRVLAVDPPPSRLYEGVRGLLLSPTSASWIAEERAAVP